MGFNLPQQIEHYRSCPPYAVGKLSNPWLIKEKGRWMMILLQLIYRSRDGSMVAQMGDEYYIQSLKRHWLIWTAVVISSNIEDILPTHSPGWYEQS